MGAIRGQTVMVGVLCAVVVLLAFGVGFLVMTGGQPAALPVVPLATGANAPRLSETQVAPAPMPAELGVWTPQESGCITEQTGTKFHITGINDQEGFNHWNGATASGSFPVADFDVSADFMVPVFKGTGNALLYLRAKTDQGNQLGIVYQPRAGRYQVQVWGPSAFSQPPLGKFGDEATAFHRLRLKYVADTHEATGWVDDKPIGTLNYALNGRVQFEMVLNTDKAGNEIDVYFDHFALSFGDKVIVPLPAAIAR